MFKKIGIELSFVKMMGSCEIHRAYTIEERMIAGLKGKKEVKDFL